MKPKLQILDDSSTDTKKNAKVRSAMNSSLSNFNPEHDPVQDLENLAKK